MPRSKFWMTLTLSLQPRCCTSIHRCVVSETGVPAAVNFSPGTDVVVSLLDRGRSWCGTNLLRLGRFGVIARTLSTPTA